MSTLAYTTLNGNVPYSGGTQNLDLGPYNLTVGGLVTFGGQYFSTMVEHTAAGVAETIDWNDGNEHRLILDENVTLTLSNPVNGGRYVLLFVQDANGGNTVTWPASVKWAGGTAPIITVGANAVSIVTLIFDGASSTYSGSFSLDHR